MAMRGRIGIFATKTADCGGAMNDPRSYMIDND
jgi:hypothetical protein